METQTNDRPRACPAVYAALRFGGCGSARAQLEMALDPEDGARLEGGFLQGRHGGMRPRFARHDAHVAAVLGAGGYPVMA